MARTPAARPAAVPHPHARRGDPGARSSVLAVPATRTIRDIPTEVVLAGGPTACRIRRCCLSAVDNVTVIRPALCVERITRLSVARAHGARSSPARATSAVDRACAARRPVAGRTADMLDATPGAAIAVERS